MGEWIYKNDIKANTTACLVIAMMGYLLAWFLHSFVGPLWTEQQQAQWPVLSLLTKRVGLVYLGLISVFFWRGMWFLQDEFLLTAQPELSAAVSFAVGLTVLLLFNGVSITIAPPLIFSSDAQGRVFRPFEQRWTFQSAAAAYKVNFRSQVTLNEN